MLDYIIPASVLSARRAFLHDVLAGLGRPRKHLPGRYLYDDRGREMALEIGELDEFYPARCEEDLLGQHASEVAAWVGPDAALLELCSGAVCRAWPLFDSLEEPAEYVAVDSADEQLLAAGIWSNGNFPRVAFTPFCADFTKPIRLPRRLREAVARRVVFFSGSSIGDFGRDETAALLRRMARLAGPGGGVLVGVDHQPDQAVLERAYDDEGGLMAAFHLNLLARIKGELGASLDLEGFDYLALHDEDGARMDMYLVSLGTQRVTVARNRFELARGELIRTATAYKGDPAGFAMMARKAGLVVRQVWCDESRPFSVVALDVAR